ETSRGGWQGTLLFEQANTADDTAGWRVLGRQATNGRDVGGAAALCGEADVDADERIAASGGAASFGAADRSIGSDGLGANFCGDGGLLCDVRDDVCSNAQ